METNWEFSGTKERTYQSLGPHRSPSRRTKTVDIEWIKGWVNHNLANSIDSRVNQRYGKCDLLESILMQTGNYKGFHYLHNDFPLKEGELYITADESRRVYL
jgi:hypothetical protein